MKSPILEVRPLGFPWAATDPFLFCVHHVDAYPAGNDQFGPSVSLEGRNLGQDFELKDGFRMYHGEVVPGFPQHPHRGFETVTIARRGLIDHSDSLGASARFGKGDVQWLTAGRGIVHSEMMPLLDKDGPNPVELFQIWLNLPSEDKMADPHFTMMWDQTIPRRVFSDDAGRKTEVTVVAGQLDGERAPSPPPSSWASRVDTEVAIWCIRMDPGAVWSLPKTERANIARTVYFFAGKNLKVADRDFDSHAAVGVDASETVVLEAGSEPVEILVLQGRPIGETVAQYGPFVMNSRAELQQAFEDYQRTRFGGWPWPSDDPVHGADGRRFAKHADGRLEHAERANQSEKSLVR